VASRISLAAIIADAAAHAPALHRAHLSEAHCTLVETLGFDRRYVRGEGQYLWDDQGRRVLDCLSGFGALAIGRAHPVVVDALRQCLDLAPPAWVRMELNPLAGAAARALVHAAKAGDMRVFFTNSGTEAVEAALKFARRHTGRPGFLAWDRAFHGLTLGALSINGNPDLCEGFGPALADARCVAFGDLDAVRRELARGDVAAMVVEPIQGKTLQQLEPARMRDLAELCRRHGTLLVADEVQTGGGRTGTFLALEADGVQPDIVTLSKCISGGFVPVGAALVSPTVWRSTYSGMGEAFVHSSTLHEGPLAMTAVLATLHVIEQDGLVERSRRLGAMLHESLRRECGAIECCVGVRGRGLMAGVAIDPARVPSASRVPVVGPLLSPMIGQCVAQDLLDRHGVLAQVTGSRSPVVKFLPPMTLDEADVQVIATATAAALRRLQRGAFFPATAQALARWALGARG
jgi:ornithine--oxo-acid transaminase